MPIQIRSFTHSYLSSTASLTEKLKGLCQDSVTHEILQEFSDVPVKDVVVSDNHLALLLGNGFIYRLDYSLSNSGENTKEKQPDDEGGSSSNVPSGSRGASPRGDQDPSNTYSFVQRFSSLARRGRAFSRRLIERRQDRLSRALLARVPNFIPAAEVPEDLIEEAMAVLQGKSREVVIRELQRTNLDVNTAVNNLLSRDEDEPVHNEEESPQFPSGDELLTLMGSGGSMVEDELEELLTLTGRNRSEDSTSRSSTREGRSSSGIYNDPLVAQEIRSWVTLADRAATGNGSAPSSSSGHAPPSSSSKGKSGSSRKDLPSSSSMYLHNECRWTSDGADKIFTHIAGLKSELLAVDDKGVLYSWPWDQPYPPSTAHPRLAQLGLQDERVKFLSTKLIRASAVTESGKIATWIDSGIYRIAYMLEQSATVYTELSGETIIHLVTSELFSAVYTESGKLMWWGVLPYAERKNQISLFQEKHRALGRANPVQEGSMVCMKTRPVYMAGCKAIYIKGGTILCGEVLENVFLINEKCRFKIIPMDEIEEEAELMETGDDEAGDKTRSDVIVHAGMKRKHPDDSTGVDDEQEKPKEELWSLRDVIFLSLPHSSAPMGRVIKLDGLYAAVLFPTRNQGNNNGDKDEGRNVSSPSLVGKEGEKENGLLSQCRLLRKDELLVMPTDANLSDPVCIQTTPKRIKLANDSLLLALTADSKGLHALVVSNGTLTLSSFNFDTIRTGHSCTFPACSTNFLLQQLPPGSLVRSLPMQLLSLGLCVWLLVDSFGGVYPLTRDAIGNMKPLTLMSLPPIHCGLSIPQTARNFMITLVIQSQKLVPMLKVCNLATLRSFLDNLPPSGSLERRV